MGSLLDIYHFFPVTGAFGYHSESCKMMFMLFLYITFLLYTISAANSHKYAYSFDCIMTRGCKQSHVHFGFQG